MRAAERGVAIYARVSSEQQAGLHTVGSQVDELLARAAADGATVPQALQFVDDGYSGATFVRPALERLRDLAALGAVSRLYVHAPDRLARSYVHQVLLAEELAQAGTELVFLNRPLGASAEDNLLLQLQGMFAEYERARILERSRRGKRHLAHAGVVSVLGRAPYGYRLVGRREAGETPRFEVVEAEAAVVRQIFAWVGVDRLTLCAVRRRLAEAGTPSPSGNPRWAQSMVWSLLTNTAYRGEAVFGKRKSLPWQPPLRPARGHTGVPKRPGRQVPAPPDQWVTIPVPALVPPALFDAVRGQLEENRRLARQRREGARHRR